MSSHDPLEHAAAQLHCAAELAEQRAQGNPLDPWSAMAGTIRLVAAGLHPTPRSMPVNAAGLHQHLAAASAALNGVPTDRAPADLPFWHAHVVDLAANARAIPARANLPSENDA